MNSNADIKDIIPDGFKFEPFKADIEKMYSLEDGGLYVLDFDIKLSQGHVDRIQSGLKRYKKERNIEFIILDKGVKVYKGEKGNEWNCM